MRHFYECFDVIEVREDETYNNFWRVFGQEYQPDMTQWTEKTRLQKSMKEYLATDNRMGTGYGVILFGKDS